MDEDPGGHGPTGIYGVVDTPDIALVIPGDRKGFHLVELYRHPIAGRCWEFPSGNADSRLDLDAGESAARELREETGLEASKQTPNVRFRPERWKEGYQMGQVDEELDRIAAALERLEGPAQAVGQRSRPR